MKTIRVWDLPVRIFHWALVILVGVSLYTGFTGGFTAMDYHMLSGYSILALVVFRILWGIAGTRHARFTSFVKGPAAVLDYLRHGETPVGHNPLGALSVLALLVVLLVQAMTGLFANDDIMTEGPLTHLVSYETSRYLTWVHEINRWVLIGLICLHVAAIAWYELVRKERLTRAMLTGHKNLGTQEPEPFDLFREGFLAPVLLAVSVAGVYILITWV